jgi:hypothetical protein
MSRIRYRGLARNAGHHQFVVAVMNMKRALVLLEHAWRPPDLRLDKPVARAAKPHPRTTATLALDPTLPRETPTALTLDEKLSHDDLRSNPDVQSPVMNAALAAIETARAGERRSGSPVGKAAT